MKKWLLLAVLAAFVSVTPVQAAVKLSPAKLVIAKGETKQFKVKGYKGTVKWSVKSKKIAKVDKYGLLKAVKAGSTTLTAKAGKKSLTAKITVENPTLSKKKLTITAGSSASLKVKNTTQKVKWTSTDTWTVTVDKKGNLTANHPGTAYVCASVLGKLLKCTVTVAPKPVPVIRIGETWDVPGQWSMTITGVRETQDRNEYADTHPAAVYIVSYTYTNIGYTDSYMDGLFLSPDSTIVDYAGYMGYSYPGDRTYYPQETPVGATCRAEVCIGVDHPGSFQLHFDMYDGNDVYQKAVFDVPVK